MSSTLSFLHFPQHIRVSMNRNRDRWEVLVSKSFCGNFSDFVSCSSSEAFQALSPKLFTGLCKASQGNRGVCTGGQVQDQALWPTQCKDGHYVRTQYKDGHNRHNCRGREKPRTKKLSCKNLRSMVSIVGDQQMVKWNKVRDQF